MVRFQNVESTMFACLCVLQYVRMICMYTLPFKMTNAMLKTKKKRPRPIVYRGSKKSALFLVFSSCCPFFLTFIFFKLFISPFDFLLAARTYMQRTAKTTSRQQLLTTHAHTASVGPF